MEHLNQSIKIVCILRRLFPDNVVYNIRSILRLAIDLNGYTNNEIIDSITSGTTYTLTTRIHQYLKTKYGYNRRKICLLKRYQLIHVIQKFNIHLPIRRYRLDQDKIFVDKYVENIKWGTQHVEYKLKDDDNIYSLNSSNSISLTNIPNCYKNYKISILIDKVTDKRVKIYTFIIENIYKLHDYKRYQLQYITISKYLLIRLMLENTLMTGSQERYYNCYPILLYSKRKSLKIQNVSSDILDKIPDTYKYRLLNNFHDRLNIIRNHFTEIKHQLNEDDTEIIITIIKEIANCLSHTSYIKDVEQYYLDKIDHSLKEYENFANIMQNS